MAFGVNPKGVADITYPKKPGTGRTAQAPPGPPGAVTNTVTPSVQPPPPGGSPALPPPVPPTAPPTAPPAAPGPPPPSGGGGIPPGSQAAQDFVAAGSPGGPGNAAAWFLAAQQAGVYNPNGSGRMNSGAGTEDQTWRGGHSADGSSDATGMRAHSRTNRMAEDFDRFDEATLQLWEEYRDASCPPRVPYRAMDGSGCVGKPIDSAGGAGGPGGSGGPGGGPGGDYWTTDPAGWGMTDEEKAYLEAVGGLAKEMTAQSQKLFGAGFPAYLQATEYWKKLGGAYGRGGVDAALGPVREQISEGYQGAQAQLRGLRGAEKAQATADLARGEAGDLGRLPAELQPMAAAGLQRAGEFGVTTGLASEGQAAGLFLGAQQAEAQSRLTEEGLGVQREGIGVQQELGYLQAQTMRQVAALQATVNREQIAAQREMATATLAQRSYEFEQMYEQRNREFKLEMERWQQQYSQQRSDSRNRLIGGVAAAGVTIAIIL